MNRLDFTDLNRFLVSLGLIFYIFAFSIPWLFFKDTIGNQIKTQELNLLTEKSKSLIERNQDYLLMISKSIPWISIILFGFGTLFIIYGITRWFKKQNLIDEKEVIELNELRRNVKTLDAKETEEKAKEEVKSETQGIEKNSEYERIYAATIENVKSWENVINIENKIVEKIRNDNPLNYEIKSNVKLLDGVVADIVLQSYTKDKQDRIIEVKYFQQHINFQNLVGVLQNMAFFASTYNNRFKKSIAGLLIIVYNEEIASSNKISELENTLMKYISQKRYGFISFEICKISEIEKLKLDKYY